MTQTTWDLAIITGILWLMLLFIGAHVIRHWNDGRPGRGE